jgi:hypothetical protein
MGERFGNVFEALDEHAQECINSWMLAYAIYRPVGLTQPGSTLFANHADNLARVLASWQQVNGADSGVAEMLARFHSEAESMADAKFVEELLESFPKRDVADRTNWVIRLRVSAWHRSLALDPILRTLRNRKSCQRFVESLSLDKLSQTIELLLAIQQYAGEPWFHELPQLLVGWLDHVRTLGQKALILNGIVCSAVAGSSPSALHRVQERDDIADLAESLSFQAERIASFRGVVPRWTWARLRAFLPHLKVHCRERLGGLLRYCIVALRQLCHDGLRVCFHLME